MKGVVSVARRGAPGRRWRRVAAVVLGMAAATAAAACEPSATASSPPIFAAVDPELGAAFLTWEGRDTYSFATATDEAGVETVTARAAAGNRGINTRAAFWRMADPSRRDQQTCATWDGSSGGVHQPGAALRISYSGGRTRAITVTENIMMGGGWVFNIHVMDSAASPAFRQIGHFDLSGVFRTSAGTLRPFPWRMCARAVAGTVSLKVWPLTHAEPAWNDPAYGGSVRLPDAWVRSSGRAGWYVGHLEAGESFTFSDLTVSSVAATATGSTPVPGSDRQVPTTTTTAPSDTTTVPVEPTTPAQEPTNIASAP